MAAVGTGILTACVALLIPILLFFQRSGMSSFCFFQLINLTSFLDAQEELFCARLHLVILHVLPIAIWLIKGKCGHWRKNHKHSRVEISSTYI